jgi:branched-chain amino acid transport system ATP-binding protein
MALLEAKGLIKIFGKLTALNGADLTVAANEFHGLIGPNGSGKSTLMKCIAGAETPTQGTVTFGGHDITQASPAERARAGMSLKFQITSVLPALDALRQHPAGVAGTDIAAQSGAVTHSRRAA